MLSVTTKKTLNVVVPVGLTGIAVFIAFRYTKDWKIITLVGVLTLIITWAITARVTKSLNQAPPRTIDANGNGVYDASYDPTALTDALYEDLTCVFCFRNFDLYNQLNALPSTAFRVVANDWNKRYFTKYKESLAVAISGENFGWLHGALQTSILEGFKLEGIN